MARIGSYPIDAVIQDKDAWIGTENTNRVTRQFTALGVAQYIDTKNVGLVFVGATANDDGAKGLVPAPVAGQEGMYLKGNLNGGWTTIPVYTLDVPTGTTNVNLINTDGAGAIINSFITLTGGTYLTSVHTSGSQITFNHDDTVRTDPTNPTPTPGPGASVDLVSAVASNATGHVTGVTTSTVTWPADSDTTYTIDVPNATTSINLAGSDGTNDPIAFTTVAGNNGMTISRTDANTLNFNSKWQINNVNQDGYVPKGTANANKFWATDGNGNPGWTFQPSQDQTLTSTGTTNASTGIVLSQNGGTVIVKGDGSTISASSNNTTNVITLEAINRVNTTYTLPVAAGAANTAIINLTDNSAVVSSVTFNGTANKIAISETVGNNGDITIGMPDDVTVTGELTVSGTGQSSFGGQITIPQTPSADTDAASKKYVDDLVSGGLTFRGTFNAATGEILSGVSSGSQLYNCPGGAGTRIAVAVGDYYIVATAGGSFYCSGATLDIGDSIIATAAAGADASVVTGWSVVQSDEGVASFTNANGTFVSAGTVNSNATGAVTMGTIDLSATGTQDSTTFLRGDNTWAVPAYVSYSAMTTSTLGLGKIKYDFGSTPAAESQSTTASRTYGVTKNASDQLVVNVPWLNSSDVNSVTASGATTALSGLSSTPNTGAVVIGLDINGRASLGSPAADDELMIYDTSTDKNVKVLVSDLASYAGSAATNQVTYWTSANEIGGATGFTFAGGANGAVTMGGALTVSSNVDVTGSIIARANASYYATRNYLGETWELASDTGDGVTFKITGGAANTSGNFFKFQTQAGGATPATALTINKDLNATFAGKILVGTGATAAASLNAYTQTVSSNLFSALRVIENSGASSYWDIGATNGASTLLNFYHNGNTTPKISFTHTGGATFAGNVTAARGFFNAGATNVVATFTSTDATSTLQCIDGVGNVEFGANGNDFVVQPAGGVAQLTVGSSSSTFGGEVSLKSRLNLQRSASGATTLIQFKNEAGTDRAHIDFGGTNEELSFFAGGGSTENMRIDSSGSVIIKNPTTSNLQLQSDQTTWDENDVISNLNTFVSDTSAAGARDVAAIKVINEQVGTNTTMSGAMAFYTSAYNATVIERMRIRSVGIVQINTNTAKTNTSTVEFASFGQSNEATNYSTLQMYTKGSASQADRSVIFQTIEAGIANAGNIVLQPSGGNVGIGTASPTNGKLEVQQTATTAALWVQTGGTTSSYTIADFRTGTNASALAIKGDGKSTFGGTGTFTDAVIVNGSYPGLTLDSTSYTRFSLTNRYSDNRLSFDVRPQGGSTIEVMDLTSNGLGIGRRTASYKFTLVSDGTTQNGVYISAGTGNGNHSLYVENQDSSAEFFAVRGDGEIRLNATSGHTYAHTGIRFGANVASNNLDDYEEGTFTATTNNDGVGQPVTANYTKIGQLVTYTVYIPSWSPTSAGTAVIAGFPFTAIITNGYGVGNVTHSTGVLNCSGGYHETTNWNGTLNNSTGRSSWVVASARSIMVTGFYYTAS